MTYKHLISISDFPNVRPTNQEYRQAYSTKNCYLCSEDATQKALYSADNNIIIQRLYCNRHIRRIKK